MTTQPLVVIVVVLLSSASAFSADEVRARLFPNVTARYPVGDPQATNPIANTEGPKSLATADMNGDGLGDVVAGNLDGSVSVLLGNRTNLLSDQLLTKPTGVLTNSSIRAVALSDFDKDGKLDVALADISGEGVVILRGNGDGALSPQSRHTLGPARALAPGDFNGDGNTDLLVACSPPDCESCFEGVILTNMPPTNRFLCILPGRGDGTFGEAQYLLKPSATACFYDVEAADLDGDGDMDAAALEFAVCYGTNGVTRTQRLHIFENPGNGEFVPDRPVRVLETSGEGPRAFRLGYLNEKLVNGAPPAGALLDLVVANRDSASVDIFLNKGGMDFAPPIPLPVGDAPRDVAASDLDLDGYAELVVVNRNKNTISIMRGMGRGEFVGPTVELGTGISPRQIALADVNGDGALDALVNNRESEDLSVFPGERGYLGFLVSGPFYGAGLSPMGLVAADFDRDGDPDVATVSIRSHDLRVRLNLGNGEFGPEEVYPMDQQPAFIANADLNGDGKQDLVISSLGGPGEAGSLVTMLGQDEGKFTAGKRTGGVSTNLLSYRRPFWVRLGDLNNDGKIDAAIGGLTGELVLYRGLGDGGFASGVLIAHPDGRPLGIALGDFDKSGFADVATSRGTIFLNGGGLLEGTYSGTNKFDAGAQAWAVEADDLDGDGILDLMVALTFVRPDPIGVYFGLGGGRLTEPTIYAGPDVGVVALTSADMDGDGKKDIVVGNRCAASVIVMRGIGERKFEFTEIITSYSVEDVEVADLNRDGKPDILGVGTGMWPIINGATNNLQFTRPELSAFAHEILGGVRVNELMAQNRRFHVVENISPDWVELYNYTIATQSLAGWTLQQVTADTATNRWQFPAGTVIPPLGHLVVYCEKNEITNGLRATFELSADGENLTLVRQDGTVADSLRFPALPEDVSYARFTDGGRFFGYNPAPTMGHSNAQAPNLDPIAERKDPFVAPGATALGLNARFFDDVGLAYAAIVYRTNSAAEFEEWDPLESTCRHASLSIL